MHALCVVSLCRRSLRAVADPRADGETDIEAVMRSFVARHKRRGLAVVISDLYDPAGYERGVNVPRYNKFEPFVLHVTDPRDAEPEARGDIMLYDCETGEEREVTVTRSVLARYAEAYQRYLKSVERFCTRTQLSYFRADVDQPFEELILRVFRRGGFLR